MLVSDYASMSAEESSMNLIESWEVKLMKEDDMSAVNPFFSFRITLLNSTLSGIISRAELKSRKASLNIPKDLAA